MKSDFALKCRQLFQPLKPGSKFWDCIVLTASNQRQAKVFEEFLALEDIPRFAPDCKVHVFSDPSTKRCGSGIATLRVIDKLKALYDGDTNLNVLKEWRILLIHCGGWSQRMPSCSISGKIFCKLPIGNPYSETATPMTLFMGRCLSLVSFVNCLPPGYLVIAGDDLELFDLADEKLDFSDQLVDGFTVLAHPSSLTIGESHGVYRFSENPDPSKVVEVLKCVQVLQKPSISMMKSIKDGVIFNQHDKDSDSGDDSICYSDSIFHFTHQIGDVLWKVGSKFGFYAEVPAQICEVDAYHDFLQCLGQFSTTDHFENTKNLAEHPSDETKKLLVRVRSSLYEELKSFPIRALVLHRSLFIHIGTLPEYLTHYHTGSSNHDPHSLSSVLVPPDTFAIGCQVAANVKFTTSNRDFLLLGCVLGDTTHQPISLEIGKKSILDTCRIDVDLKVGRGSVVTDVELSSQPSCQCECHEKAPSLFVIPDSVAIFCVELENGGCVCVIFGIDDQMKKLSPPGKSLSWCGKPFIPEISLHDNEQRSLWNSLSFPSACCKQASLISTLAKLNLEEKVKGCQKFESTSFTMIDILERYDLTKLINFKKELFI